MGYRADLDGIRCVAVLMVLIFHFELFPLGDGGFVGVDVFFVLSGFLISGLIWRDLAAGTFSLKDFYVRRLRRLGPSLLVVQIGALLFAALLLLPSATLSLARQSVYTQLYVVNVHFWKSIDYFGLHTRHQPLLHCWSLAVEEQFYLFFPLLVLVVHRYFRGWWPRVLVGGALLSFGLNLAFVQTKPQAAFYLLPTRAWELLAGALIPYLSPAFTRPLAKNVAGGLGVVLLIATLALHDPGVAFPGWFALLPVAATMSLVLAGAGVGSWVSRALSLPAIVYVGRISYSLYLVHWPIRVFTDALVESYSLPWRVTGFVLSFVLAALLYRFVEDPIRRRQLLAQTRPFLIVYFSLVGLVVACAVWAMQSHGWQGRFSERVLAITRYADDVDTRHRNCEKRKGVPLNPDCTLGQPNAPSTFTIIGDSHAMALAEAFSQSLARQGTSGVLIARHGCLPLLGLDGTHCEEFMAEALSMATSPGQGENVVLVSVWRRSFEVGLMGPGRQWLQGTAAEQAFAQKFRETVDQLHRAGKRTYIWMGLPVSPASVPETLARNEAYGTHLPVASALSLYEREYEHLFAAVAASAPQVTGTISAMSALCPDGTCRFVREGLPLFSDSNHPTLSSAAFFSAIISDELAKTSPLIHHGDLQ
ncbi:MAG TPA: acyltransferase family protein [Polyangiaceae bacterium]|nr:acyltransferase family protein [Polyangiaceae bacterium]